MMKTADNSPFDGSIGRKPFSENLPYLTVVFALFLLNFLASCAHNPKHEIDWVDSKYPFWEHEYQIGDRYETRKPMFLKKMSRYEYWLELPGPHNSNPTLDEYRKNSERWRRERRFPIVEIVPPGTVFELVAIKDRMANDQQWFRMDGISGWVLLEDFDYIDMDLYPERHLDRYNRRLYRRVECGQAQ